MQKTILALLLSYTIFGTFRFSTSVILPEIVREFNLSPFETGLIFGMMFLIMAITMASYGKIIISLGEYKTYFLASLILSSSIIFFSLSPLYLFLIFSSALIGLGNGLLTPSLFSSLGRWRPKIRGLLLGLANSLYSIGGILGSLISSLTTLIYGWRFSLLIYGLSSFLPTFLLLKGNIEGSLSDFSLKVSYRRIFKSKIFLRAYFGMFFSNFSFLLIVTWYPIYLESLGFKVNEIGLIFILFAFFGALGSFILGGISDKFNKINLLSIMALVASISSLLFILLPKDLSFLIISIIGFTLFPFWSIFIALAQSYVKREEGATVTGLLQNSAIIAATLSPLISGAIIPYLSLNLTLLILTPLNFFLTFLIIKIK